MIAAVPQSTAQSWTVLLPDEAATARLAAGLALLLRTGDVLALQGTLGAGKTAFARALIQARAGAEIEVPSPTFTLVQTYVLPGLVLWHFDLYRLSNPDEVIELGWDEALETAALLVEWPDRAGALLPAGALTLSLAVTGDVSRRATLTVPLAAGSAWADRRIALEGLFQRDPACMA
jgi:tRNA threonylcarbamoyladenosine biosynthesis protein TsaE